jgi:hypothetical protein
MNAAVESIRLKHDLKHYQSELRVVSDPRDMRVLIEIIALIEMRLRDCQVVRRAGARAGRR